MPIDLKAIIARLLARAGGDIDLDAIGDEIGDRAVSVDDIDYIIAALEAAGRQVGVREGAPPSTSLRRVVQAARQLRHTLGRVPTTEEIAAHAQLEAHEVRTVLLFVRVLQR